MAVAQPTIMTAVPRFYQNLFSKISLNFSKQKGLKKKLIESTIYLGTKSLNGKEINFKSIHKSIPTAKELHTFTTVLSKRGWDIRFQ